MALLHDRHMHLAQWSLLVLGLAHINFISPKQERLYKRYRNCVLVWFVIFLTSEFIEVPFIIKEKNWSDLIDNLTVSMLYISTTVKFTTLMGARIKYLVKDVRDVEKIILESADETMKHISESFRGYNNKLSMLILFGVGVMSISLWYGNPALNYLDWKFSNHPVNETYERVLIFIQWFPYDWHAHYWLSYVYQFICGFYGATITVCPDAFLWGFMTFALMNLEILKYKLDKIPEHTKETMKVNPWMDERIAIRVVTNKCILLHRRIIAFVKNLNRAMNFMMLIDFCICSIQIAATALRILYFGNKTLMLISAAEFLWAMTTQMLLFYWNANEILLESQNISMTIICSRWYNYDLDIIKDLQFVMLRAKHPLLLNIGPFYAMSNSVAISILRAAYSFIALMRSVG